MKFRVCDLYNAIFNTYLTEEVADKLPQYTTFKTKHFTSRDIHKFITDNTGENFTVAQVLISEYNNVMNYMQLGYGHLYDNFIKKEFIRILRLTEPNVVDTYLNLNLSDNELMAVLSVVDDEVRFTRKPKNYEVPISDALKFFLATKNS